MSDIKHPTLLPSDQTASSAASNTPIAHATPQQKAAAPVRKNKVRIIVSIDPDLLATLDALAMRKGLSRAGTISLACADLLDREQRLNHGLAG